VGVKTVTEPTTDRGETPEGLREYAADVLEDAATAIRSDDVDGGHGLVDDALTALADADTLEGWARGWKSTKERRPEGLPENVVEPRCGDLVQFRHLDEPGLFQVSTTSRYAGEEPTNNYGFSEVEGDRTFNLRGDEFAGLWDTEKSAQWPVVYTAVDLMKRRRDTVHGGVTYHGEPLDSTKSEDRS